MIIRIDAVDTYAVAVHITLAFANRLNRFVAVGESVYKYGIA